ncbi:MAG: hypothetical protein FMNOHCHN_03333 [Ignavibacteriaceae bacterium]|nr:hypothetical protein [Ignavibacteriaceae bacterium]
MTDYIEVNIDRIKRSINKKRSEFFTTADIIREYSGGFYSNLGTPVKYSFNAQFGMILKRNARYLKIKEVQPKKQIRDDNGHITKSSKWCSTI